MGRCVDRKKEQKEPVPATPLRPPTCLPGTTAGFRLWFRETRALGSRVTHQAGSGYEVS